MKRPARLGNITGLMLNNILFRIITSLRGTNPDQLLRIWDISLYVFFFSVGKWKSQNVEKHSQVRHQSCEQFICRIWLAPSVSVQRQNKSLIESIRHQSPKCSSRPGNAGSEQTSTVRSAKPNWLCTQAHSSFGQCRAQYKEREKQIMCNPITLTQAYTPFMELHVMRLFRNPNSSNKACLTAELNFFWKPRVHVLSQK